MPFLDEAARAQFLLVVAGACGVLVVAGFVSRAMRRRDAAGVRAAVLDNVDARIRAWWAMVAVFSVAVLAGGGGIAALFAAVSALALREFLSHAPPALRDRASDAAAYAFVALQYAAVALAWPRTAAFALPVAAAFALPIVAIAGGRGAWRERAAFRFGALMAAGWCLSHVPALATMDVAVAPGRALLLVVWLVVVLQGSDVLQYLFGKLLGRHRVAPSISPDKTVEGLAGGVTAAAALGAALAPLTPFGPAKAFALALALALAGFAGGLALSAAKRALGIKDWSRAIPGHGGVLDRVDSLVLPAPALYYALRVPGIG